MAVLWQFVRDTAGGTVQPHWLHIHELHVTVTETTPTTHTTYITLVTSTTHGTYVTLVTSTTNCRLRSSASTLPPCVKAALLVNITRDAGENVEQNYFAN